jgi:serine/threonine protein kinase
MSQQSNNNPPALPRIHEGDDWEVPPGERTHFGPPPMDSWEEGKDEAASPPAAPAPSGARKVGPPKKREGASDAPPYSTPFRGVSPPSHPRPAVSSMAKPPFPSAPPPNAAFPPASTRGSMPHQSTVQPFNPSGGHNPFASPAGPYGQPAPGGYGSQPLPPPPPMNSPTRPAASHPLQHLPPVQPPQPPPHHHPPHQHSSHQQHPPAQPQSAQPQSAQHQPAQHQHQSAQHQSAQHQYQPAQPQHPPPPAYYDSAPSLPPHESPRGGEPVGAATRHDNTNGGANARDNARDPRSGQGMHVVRSHSYSFTLDARGMPIEIGSGRFAKAFLGEERWLESKTDYRRSIVIKALQKGVIEDDRMRFQIEKELLERVQGHPNIIALFASGEADDPSFIPPAARDKVDNDFLILERLDMSLEERLKGSRSKGQRDDLLACGPKERLFRVLDYMLPVSSAVEYAHLRRNICHRDIKPANILVKLPDEDLRGSKLEVRLADFNVAKIKDEEVNFGMTRMHGVPGTLFFQSPEQETNIIELLVNVHQGVPEVEYFEDFYVHIAQNDTFSIFNNNEQYSIQYADRARKRIVLDRPFRGTSEVNVRARIQKSVGRPADIYSIGALFYYLISGAYANPKSLYDAFHKFIEYEKNDENNTIESYLNHEYSVIESLRAPKTEGAAVAPADRFFSYKHYLDGNGELIDRNVMYIIARCMIRNKPDSYCAAHDVETRGISDVVRDLNELYVLAGVDPAARPAQLARRYPEGVRGNVVGRWLNRSGNRMRWFWLALKRTVSRR